MGTFSELVTGVILITCGRRSGEIGLSFLWSPVFQSYGDIVCTVGSMVGDAGLEPATFSV